MPEKLIGCWLVTLWTVLPHRAQKLVKLATLVTMPCRSKSCVLVGFDGTFGWSNSSSPRLSVMGTCNSQRRTRWRASLTLSLPSLWRSSAFALPLLCLACANLAFFVVTGFFPCDSLGKGRGSTLEFSVTPEVPNRETEPFANKPISGFFCQSRSSARRLYSLGS